MDAVELVEDLFEIGRRDAGALVADVDPHAPPVAPRHEAHGRPHRGVFGGIVEEVEQHLLEQHGVEVQHRQIGGEVELDLVPGEDRRGAFERAADQLGEIDRPQPRRHGARFEPRHVEEIGDKAVEPLGLLADRAGQLLERLLVELAAIA